MKVKSTELREVLATVAPGVSESGVTIEQSQSIAFTGVAIQTYNDRVAISTPILEGLKGLVCAVYARDLIRVLSKIGEAELDVVFEAGRLHLRSPKAKLSVSAEAELKLQYGTVGIPKEWTKLPDGFSSMVMDVSSCCGADLSRFALTNVHVEGDLVEATDGHRYLAGKLAGKLPALLIPVSVVSSFKLFSPTQVGFTPGWVHFRSTKPEVSFAYRNGVSTEYPGTKAVRAAEDGATTLRLPDLREGVLLVSQVFESGDQTAFVQVDIQGLECRLTAVGPHSTAATRVKMPEAVSEQLQFSLPVRVVTGFAEVLSTAPVEVSKSKIRMASKSLLYVAALARHSTPGA
jgi:hypothetical protein